jgi:hypothetical protein
MAAIKAAIAAARRMSVTFDDGRGHVSTAGLFAGQTEEEWNPGITPS